MATFQAQSGFTTDPETGCVHGYNNYEQCRTNYFLKQQNEILKNQQSDSNNGNGNAKVMGTSTEAQAQGQTNNNLAAVGEATSGFNFSLAYLLILVAAIITTVVITKYFTKKKEDEMQVVFFRKNPIKPKDNETTKL